MFQKLGFSSKQFLFWVFANILGFGVFGTAILIFPSLLSISSVVVTILIITIPISFAQWIVLRRMLKTSILWILTIPIGMPLGFLVIQLIPDGVWQVVDDESIATLTALYFLIGLVIGLLQWLILRHQLSKSSIWLFGSSISVAAGFWIILVTDLVNQSGIISYIVGGLVYSIVTGLILSGLLAYHNQSRINLINAT